jgi:hypothetical protein
MLAPIQTVRSTLPSAARTPPAQLLLEHHRRLAGPQHHLAFVGQPPGPVLTAHHHHHLALDLCAAYAFARIGAALAQGHAHSLPIRGDPHVAASPQPGFLWQG